MWVMPREVGVDHVLHGAARRPLPGHAAQPGRLPDVNVHGQGVDGLRLAGEPVDVARQRIDAEGLGGGGAESLLIRAIGEELVAAGAVAAVRAQDAGLVLHLHHDHGAVRLVDLPDVLHQPHQGVAVAPPGALAVVALADGRLAVAVERRRIGHVVETDVVGGVEGAAVLPGGKPERDDPQAVGARLHDALVDHAEVVAARLGLDFTPVGGQGDGVGAHAPGVGHERVHLLGGKATVAVPLQAEDEEGTAVDQEARLAGGLDDLR